MKLDWSNWFKGIFAAIIGGGAGGVTTAISGSLVLPDQVNVHAGLHNMMLLMGTNFVISGAMSMFFYLKQSPVPLSEPIVPVTPAPANQPAAPSPVAPPPPSK